MTEMFSWYIDNNRYFRNDFTDDIISITREAQEKDSAISDIYKNRHPEVGNKGAPITAARDFGIIGENDLSDSTIMYEKGFYRFSDLVFDLISKRNVSKDNDIKLKPLVVLSKFFKIVYDLNIDDRERYITTWECYKYLSVIDNYEDVNQNYVLTIINNREYEGDNDFPKKDISVRNEVCLSEIFSALDDTGVFIQGNKTQYSKKKRKFILRIEDKYIELVRFIAENGPKISMAPPCSKGDRIRLYKYLSNLKTGVMEIIPDFVLKEKIPKKRTQDFFEYIFGIADTDTLTSYVDSSCYGMYRVFYPIRNIVFAKIFLIDSDLGEQLVDYSMQTNPYEEYFIEGELHMKIPFESGHSTINELKNKNPLERIAPRKNTRYALNNILYGAPGTGKTYATAQYALAIVEDKDLADIQKEIRSEVMSRYNSYRSKGQIVFTTFHQNYGYEDFIQGVRPDTSNKDLSFKTVNGVFKTIAENAIHDPQNNYIIVIDEINRANISKVFGELITLIEEDKRWGEENAISVTLPSGDVFAVPNNLYIIGTMNSADKSISLIDSALRRRFNFIEFTPNSNLVEDGKLKTVLETLNDGLRQELQSTDLLIGHSYFMNKDINDLEDIMNQNIIPLLYEYFFDNEKKVEAQIRNAIEGMNVDIQVGKMGRIKIIKKDNKDA